MPDDKELKEGQKVADVSGLRDEGVDILTDSELRDGRKMGGVDAETPLMGNSSVGEEVAAYLREFDTPTAKATSGEVREPEQKFFSAASPFIPKKPEPQREDAEFNPPEGVSKTSLSSMGSKVLGSGPEGMKEDWTTPQKPAIQTGTRVGPQSPRFEVIKPLRTFKGDAEEAIRYQNMSALSIKAAEVRKTEEKSKPVKKFVTEPKKVVEEKLEKVTEPKPETPQAPVTPPEPKAPRVPIVIPWAKIFVFLISISLVGAGGYALYFVYTKKQAEKPIPVVVVQLPQEKSLLRSDKSVGFDEGTNPFGSFMTAVANTQNQGVAIVGVRIYNASSTESNLSPKAFFENIQMPDRLNRVLGKDMALGFYQDASGIRYPFMVFKTTYFENTFIGMLDWEKTINGDIGQFVKTSYPMQTSTSTKTFSWSDKVILNKDSRVFGDKKQSTIVYSILNRDTVLVTTGEDAFKELLKRYTESRSVR